MAGLGHRKVCHQKQGTQIKVAAQQEGRIMLGISPNEEEASFLLSVNDEPEQLRKESEIRKTSVSVVTMILSLIVTVATVAVVTTSTQPSAVPAVENFAVKSTSLWSLPTFDSIFNVDPRVPSFLILYSYSFLELTHTLH